MDPGVDFETFEEIVSFSGLNEDKLDNEFDDDDIEETILLENIPEKQLVKQSEGRENTSPFDILPEELILNIFSFLTVQELCRYVALVCKLWLHYSKCPLLRQKLSFWESTRVFPLEEISDFIKIKSPLLKDLCLQPRTEMTLHGCSMLAQSCPHLQVLSLSFCDQVTVHILNQFVTFCPNLRDINLAGCAVTDHCLEGLNKLPLRKLNASHCTRLTDNGLKFLSKECRQLCYLNFDGIQWITHDAIATLVENCHGQLEHLWLDGENMIDCTVELIVKCRHLKSFGLSFCDSLTDQSLMSVQNMVNLTSLTLKKGTEFSAEALRNLFEQLHPHRTGSASGLLHVNIAECTNLNDMAVKALADSCRNLQSIDISWCWEVTDIGLQHVVHNCSRMVDMNICGAKDLRGNPLKSIPQQMPRLKRLDATQCNLVPDELLDELVSIMPQMIIINYYGEEVLPPKYIAGKHVITQGGWCK